LFEDPTLPGHHLTLIAEALAGHMDLREQLDGVVNIELQPFEQALCSPPGAAFILDIDLAKGSHLQAVKEWLARKPTKARAIIAVDKSSHLQQARAFALGATDILARPLEGRELLKVLWGDIGSLSGDPGNETIRNSPAVATAVDTLQNVFSSACLGGPLDSGTLDTANQVIVGQLETLGLNNWIETVRTHHSATYQHCLLVTGLAVAFGQQIGASRTDRKRLSCAGMLHDIGKARIPVTILEKPGRLDDQETELMKKHPEFGFKALETVEGLHKEMLDIVIHHHEYLDGTGYPHGLRAHEISDLVRMVTIADIFGALIERRSYRRPLPAPEAYKILVDMGPKLDQALVRAFRSVAQLEQHQLAAAAHAVH
jgi:putative nucleotidyltransferase with HDIG domain